MSKFPNRKFAKPINNSGELKEPPADKEAELSVLGAVLIKNECMDEVLGVVRPEHFYYPTRDIFSAMVEIHERREPIDAVTLASELKKRGDFERIGGSTTITALIHRVPTVSNVLHYAKIVREKASLRGMIIACTRSIQEAQEGMESTREILDHAEARIMDATDNREGTELERVGNFIGKAYEELSTIQKNKVSGIPTGFEELDEMIDGMQKGDLIVLGARPSVGKTSLSLNIAWNVVSGENQKKLKIPVAFFSIEMQKEKIARRLLCSAARVNIKRAKRGEILDSERVQLARCSGEINEAGFYLDDSSNLTVLEIRAKARRAKRTRGIELLIVDYLQLIRPGVNKETHEQEIAFVSSGLKSLAKDLNIPVLLLSQLSRPEKGKESKEPSLSDLRGSGCIEADADVVIFIHRDGPPMTGKHELLVWKNRDGETGRVPIRFDASCTRFEPEPKVVVPIVTEYDETKRRREWA